MKSFKVALILLFLVFQAAAFAQESLYLLQGDRLFVLDAEDGRIEDDFTSNDADFLLGTPGGKYIFVLDSQSGLGRAVDFETPSISKPLDLSAWAPLDQLLFSPMGNTFYLRGSGSSDLIAFNHRAGELSSPKTLVLPEAEESGSLAVNSRGTRIYAAGADGLGFHLASDGSRIKAVADADASSWTMAPSGRQLWGTGERGWQIVDENRGRVTARIDASAPISLPEFDTTGRKAWALADGGLSLVSFDVRRTKTDLRLALDQAASGLATSEAGVWLIHENGLLLIKNGSPDLQVGLPGRGPAAGFISVTLKPGQGFACF